MLVKRQVNNQDVSFIVKLNPNSETGLDGLPEDIKLAIQETHTKDEVLRDPLLIINNVLYAIEVKDIAARKKTLKKKNEEAPEDVEILNWRDRQEKEKASLLSHQDNDKDKVSE